MVLTVLCDVDEVLAGFVGGARAAHGWSRERLEEAWHPGTWSILEPMSLTEAAFWAPINEAGERFWADLPVLLWAHDLLDHLTLYTPNWYLVTSPSQSPDSYSGKMVWIQNLLGKDFNRVVITRYKHLLANPHTVLIDDREESVKKFAQHGGHGITFPARNNRLYSQDHDPLPYVFKRLTALCRELNFEERTDALQISQCERRLPQTRYGLL